MDESVTVCLITTPDEAPGRFFGRLEGSDELIVKGSRQPLVDGARVLLARGFDPAVPLTMRHAGKACDGFRPALLGKWAKLAYEESEKKPLRQVRWMPFPTAAGRWGLASGQKAPVSQILSLAGCPLAVIGHYNRVRLTVPAPAHYVPVPRGPGTYDGTAREADFGKDR